MQKLLPAPYYDILCPQIQNRGLVPWYENARKTVAPLRAHIAEKTGRANEREMKTSLTNRAEA